MRKTEDERSSSQNGINSCSLSALWSSNFFRVVLLQTQASQDLALKRSTRRESAEA